MREVPIYSEFIKLDAFLKLAGCVTSGGQAKQIVQGGRVSVNDTICTQRGKKLTAGDTVRIDKNIFACVKAEQKGPVA